MLRLSIEEPIKSNKYVYELQKGRVILGANKQPFLNRYIFGWWGRNEDIKENFRELLEEIEKQLLQDAYLIDTWEDEVSNYSKLRSLLYKKKKEKEGWTIAHQNNFYLALKKNTLKNFFYSPYRACILGQFGPQSLSNPTINNVFKHFKNIVAPNNHFMNWLVDNNLTFIYKARSETEDNMLILLTSKKLNLENIQKLFRIEKTKELGYVWNLP